ncbi:MULTISPECIES: hypothetical protein [Pectobacterium]|uniref:Uncharacterized protein n=1 Tax=Pectobacterium parvum TaxID=2778550 RepID=A0AAP9LC18_9GAMM|nr:hypothetical protein [Pectobacterium parvum]QHQ23746.1 hypothetical protein GMX10_06415 [Pectobacterium parvum]GKW43198.1 hypothetical protein PEC301879_30560 [Pectobacterium carotovorum subsp. carotovorum]
MERESGLSLALSGGNGNVAGKQVVRRTLRNYDTPVGEAMTLVKALNIMTLQGMPDSVRIAREAGKWLYCLSKIIYSKKLVLRIKFLILKPCISIIKPWKK